MADLNHCGIMHARRQTPSMAHLTNWCTDEWRESVANSIKSCGPPTPNPPRNPSAKMERVMKVDDEITFEEAKKTDEYKSIRVQIFPDFAECVAKDSMKTVHSKSSQQ